MKLGKFIAICLDEFIFLLIIQVCIHILDFITYLMSNTNYNVGKNLAEIFAIRQN